MKHLLMIVFAIALLVLGFGVIVATFVAKATLTTPVLIFAASCILLAMALAIPAELQQAKGTLVDVGRAVKDAVSSTNPPGGAA